MAMTTCRECKAPVSTKAKACPACGAARGGGGGGGNRVVGCLAMLALLSFGGWKMLGFVANYQPAPAPILTPEQTRAKSISDQFSASGQSWPVSDYIRANMNDPKSYEWVSTNYHDMGDHLIVNQEYRGRNAFGGVVTEGVKARVSLNGQVESILETW
jgi:hypothetical protein